VDVHLVTLALWNHVIFGVLCCLVDLSRVLIVVIFLQSQSLPLRVKG